MIRGAVEVATAITSNLRSLPDFMLGGWHPMLVPDETLSEPFVDVVVQGQGEVTLVEVAEALLAKRSLEGIAGVSWKSNGQRRHNPDRHVEPLDALPVPAFDLTDFDAYERLSGGRKIGYATSVGCPYACNYLTDMVFYKRRFNALSNQERVVSELVDLVTRYRIEEVALLDSNFPVQLLPARSISPAVSSHPASSFEWTFQASTDFLCRMSEEEVILLGEKQRCAYGLWHGVHV